MLCDCYVIELGVVSLWQVLDLSQNLLEGSCFSSGRRFNQLLSQMTTLTSIDLNQNPLLGPAAWCTIINALRDNKNHKIGTWSISDQQRMDPDVVKALAGFLAASRALTSIGEKGLNLMGSQVGDEGWGAIISAVCASTVSSVATIDVNSERIGNVGAKAISKSIGASVNKALKSINLVGHDFDAAHASSLTEVARKKEIFLCGITPDQADADFSNQGLQRADALLLASDLRASKALKEIDLRGNEFGSAEWCAIFNALRDNKANTIEAWNLPDQGLDAEVAKAISGYLAR